MIVLQLPVSVYLLALYSGQSERNLALYRCGIDGVWFRGGPFFSVLTVWA
jgi:hypothetical protein